MVLFGLGVCRFSEVLLYEWGILASSVEEG